MDIAKKIAEVCFLICSCDDVMPTDERVWTEPDEHIEENKEEKAADSVTSDN